MRRKITPRSRTRLVPDFSRLAQAVTRPGIDTREHFAICRIDEDTDEQKSIRWDDELGWLVTVTVMQGNFAGQGGIVCRYASDSQGQVSTKAVPPRSGVMVGVAFPSGDPNEDAVILGQIHDIDHPVPAEINGDTIVERDPSEGEIAAIDTHIGVYPVEDLDEEWRNVRITADKMILGTADADQSFPRGEDQADAIEAAMDAILDFANAVVGANYTTGSLVFVPPYTIANLTIAIEQFKNARSEYLSERIKGD